jgi:UDP-N-acetylglucosamine--N-acetylmuramyl-(pentapeptide) pyrophosphoryl-undecaprenol N-acetylglucosamine transferase
MKILITGAHFTPALAVIEELQKIGRSENQKIRIVYVGRKHTLEGDKAPSAESQILPEKGVHFIPIIAGRLKRDFSLLTIWSWVKIPIGFMQAFWIVLTQRPDVVVSFGGYLAVPVVFAAWLFNIPILIHDQTLVFGLASTVSSWFADKVAVTFDKDYHVAKSKLILTGNPIRNDFFQVEKKSFKNGLPTILITGGNQGSHFINEKIGENLEKLTEKYLVVHQTGDSKFKDYDHLLEQKKTLKNPQNYKLEKFIPTDKMAQLMKQADLVICRAGANTLLELAFLGTPTLIIPIPYVQKDEQTVNAKFFAQAGLGEFLNQNSLTAEKLLEKITEMLHKKEFYKKQANKAKSLVYMDAAKKLTQEILILAQHA